MKNLPVFTQNMLKGCKVFALVGMLSLCCACGGSTPSETPEGEVSASPMSGEIEVKGNEVGSSSGQATTEETKSKATDSTTESQDSTAESETDNNTEANNASAKKAEETKQGGNTKAVGNVRDPFDKYYGAPAIGTSLSGGIKPSSDKGIKDSSAYKKYLKGKKKDDNKPVVKVNKPNVKVTGLFRSGSSYKAILQGPERAVIVGIGEKIGGYSVTAITSKDVTLVYKGKYKFVIPMEKEVFGSTGASETASKLGNNEAVEAPVVEVSK